MVYFFSLVLVAICVVPVLYIIFGGFRTNAQITNNPAGLPNPWVISNYKEVITSDIFWTELVNSLIVGICTMVGVRRPRHHGQLRPSPATGSGTRH